MSEGRSVEQRKSDTVAALSQQRDLWLATADRSGRPHLVAVSAWWDGRDVIIATSTASRTARNLESTRTARLALGAPNDVIVLDAAASDGMSVREAEAPLANGFASAVGWDPRDIDGEWAFFRLTPSRIQAYRGYDELQGRDVMRAGRWLA
jgi:hypothetical protein